MFKEILEDLGYKLSDCGNHWRTSALYRGGDNSTALQIYKDSGVWTDFVSEQSNQPFRRLIELTLKGQPDKLKETLQSIKTGEQSLTQHKPKTLIEMEKIYDDSILEKLFPNYNFYDKKNISESTQKKFKLGLAGQGNMYRRMVFPIYNEHSQIVGFSGRTVDKNKNPKWKHIGKKNRWVYPAYVPSKESVDEIIDQCESVYIVESIGDAMALFDSGVKNVVVNFGLYISPAIITYLTSKNLKEIILAGNNDFSSPKNRGLMGSIKNYLKLSSYFDLDYICIKNPPKGYNDLGDAHQDGQDLKLWSKKEVNLKEQRKFISEFVKNNRMEFSKIHATKAQKINE